MTTLTLVIVVITLVALVLIYQKINSLEKLVNTFASQPKMIPCVVRDDVKAVITTSDSGNTDGYFTITYTLMENGVDVSSEYLAEWHPTGLTDPDSIVGNIHIYCDDDPHSQNPNLYTQQIYIPKTNLPYSYKIHVTKQGDGAGTEDVKDPR